MDERIINISRDINAPIRELFAHLIDEKKISDWLCLKAKIQPKPGGDFFLYWAPNDPDPSNDSTHGCKILALEEPYLLNVEWLGNREQKHYMNIADPLTNVTFILYPLKADKTKITIIHSGWQSGSDWDEAYAFFTNAWSSSIDTLKKLFN